MHFHKEGLPLTQLYPLTHFEEYMLVDETIDHPMTFFLRVDLVGRVQVAEFAAAFAEVVHRHPIFWSTVVRCRRRLAWQMVPERMPKLSVRRTTMLDDCQLKSYIDLEHEPGIRAQLNLGGNNAQLWIQFHHSCSDGISGLRFLHELFEAYRLRVSGGTSSGSGEPGSFPTSRCAFGELSWGARIGRLLLDSSRIWALMRPQLITLEHRSIDGPERQLTATPSFLEARLPFTRAMMGDLQRTQPRAPTVNDVLLRDVYLALGDWIRVHQPSKQGHWIRILAPTNMRKPGADQLRCHNDLGMVFLDRRLRRLKHKSKLLSGISGEMAQIKRDKMGHAFLRVLRWSRAFPGGIVFAKKARRIYATAVVSNLGNVFAQQCSAGQMKIADLTVNNFGFLVPIRKGTPVSFGVLTHANEFTIGMQYDDGMIDRKSAQQLLEYVLGYLSRSFGIGHEQLQRGGNQRAA